LNEYETCFQEYDGTVYKLMEPAPRFAVPLPKPVGRGRISLREPPPVPSRRRTLTRAELRKAAHASAPTLASPSYSPPSGGPREVSPTPSGADRMDVGTADSVGSGGGGGGGGAGDVSP
jgi:hypothetical protein